MKLIFTLCLFILLALNANGQSQNVDSLMNVLNTQKPTEDEQIRIYNQLVSFYKRKDVKKGLFYAKKGLAVAEKQKDKEEAFWLSMSVGTQYGNLGIIDTAMIYLEKALTLADNIKDGEKNKAPVYGNMGNIYYQRNNMTAALEYFIKAKSIADHTGDKTTLLNSLISIAGIHRTICNYDKAIEYYEQAKTLAEELNDSSALCSYYYGIGAVYSDKKEDKKSLEYNLKLIDISQTTHSVHYEILGKLALARIYNSKRSSDLNKALTYINQADTLTEVYGNSRLIAAAKELKSNIYCSLGLYKEAEVAALKALELSSIESGITKRNTLANLVTIYILLGNKEKAIDYFVEYDKVIDQEKEKSVHNSMSEMEVKYETEKKELRINSLEKERQLYVWLGITGVMLTFSLGTALWLKARNSKKEKLLVASKAVQDGEMGERERIASELHDRLLGTLSAVKSELNNMDVSYKLDDCIEEIRRISRNLMPLPLRFGIKTALEDFTAQFSNVYFHFFGQEKRIEKRLEFAVYCCVSELVTNSIRHSGAKNINVQMVQGEDHISIIVQDDGCGFDEKTVIKGVGLKSIQDRVTSCNGKMEIFSSPDKGTETIIEINI